MRAQAFDLFLHRGADIVAAHHRAQAARRGDGLQSGDARADHQHLGGSDRARRASSAWGTCAAAIGARVSAALYPAMVAMEDSASMLCARVMRGTSSMAKKEAPARGQIRALPARR